VPDAPAAFMPLRDDGLEIALVDDADHMFLDFYAEDAADLIAEFMDHEAEETAVDFNSADLEYGAYLGQECASCHSVGGSNPPLDGLEAGYLHHALAQYASGERENAAMALVARSLDDEQRIAVAAHFAAQLQ
jgi:cytochrome c553